MNKNKKTPVRTKKSATPDLSSYMSTKAVGGPDNPDTVGRCIQTTVKFLYTPTVGATGFTPSDILSSVPGNYENSLLSAPLYWHFIRIIKVSVYDVGSGSGPTAPQASITFPVDPRTISDYGAQGASIARVHVRPPLSLLQRWLPGTDATTKIFTVTTSASGATGVIYVTAELLSNSDVKNST